MTELTQFQVSRSDDVALYHAVRDRMTGLAAGLSAEDLAAQPMADASPGKWHLAHTSWFFEAMILASEPGYQPVDPRFQRLFNSYYDALGDRVDRHERGLMTRPNLDDVLAYRREIDRRMVDRLSRGLTSGAESYLFVLGLHHDQQHQELFLMDLMNLMSGSPLNTAAYAVEPRPGGPLQPETSRWPGLAGTPRFSGREWSHRQFSPPRGHRTPPDSATGSWGPGNVARSIAHPWPSMSDHFESAPRHAR